MRTLFLFLSLVLFAVNAYAQTSSSSGQAVFETDIYGRFENGVYTNDVLGLAFTIPKKWNGRRWGSAVEARVEEQQKQTLGTNEKALKQVERIARDEIKIFRFEKKILEPFYHTLISISAQKLWEKPGTMQQSMEAIRKLLFNSTNQPEVSEVKSIKIGDVEGVYVDYSRVIQGKVFKQRLHQFRNKGYMIGLSFSWFDDEDLKLMENALKTMKFE